MNLLRLRETNETPPDGYRFVHPEDGYRNGPFNRREDWLEAILKHKVDNGYAVPENWRELACDQLARMLPAGWAFYEDGSAPQYFVDARMKPDDIINGTRMLAELVARAAVFKLFGFDSPLVDQKLAESRAVTCSRCPFNINVQGCAPCMGIANIIAEMAGEMETSSDAQLKTCAICKCSNKAQTRIRAEVLRDGVTGEMMTLFPDGWCWKKAEILALS